MNQTRTFLLIAWLSVATLLFMEWNRAPQVAEVAPAGQLAGSSDLPAVSSANTATATNLPPVAGAPTASAVAANAAADAGQILKINNDVLSLEISSHGGKVIAADLLAYPLSKESPSAKVRLLDAAPARFFQADTGLLTAGGDALTANAAFTVEKRTGDSLSLRWNDPVSGLQLRKTYALTPGSYVLNVRQDIHNPGSAAQVAYSYEELTRAAPPVQSGMTNPEAYSFVGAAWYSPQDKFEKRTFDEFSEDGPLSKDVTGGWISMLQHHFLAAWVPDNKTERRFQLTQSVGVNQTPLYSIRAVSGMQAAPGATVTSQSQLWVGPKKQKALDAFVPTLKLSVDYGILTFIAQPVFDWMLSPLHVLAGNWGWAIILTVVVLKLLLYPLSAAQFKSFAKLRAVQPRIEALKERYGEDKQKFQMAMMELYKKEKINPIGGCLPVLLTIPIFIALYYVLLESVEMRQAPWMGWIDNLTAADPYFVLPAINLLVMWFTQKLTPTPGMDPLQKKMMQFMPLIFGVMFAFAPSGLVLYWCTNGLLGLAQQQFITRRHGEKAA